MSHRNICIVHDQKEEAAQQFIVMEYVDGTTLRRYFQPAIEKVETALGYATEIYEVLEHTNGKGIVQRYIKADNVMINGLNPIKVREWSPVWCSEVSTNVYQCFDLAYSAGKSHGGRESCSIVMNDSSGCPLDSVQQTA